MTGNIDSLLSNKNTVKTLEFILGMAKDSYQRQLKEINKFPNTHKTIKLYQELNIKDAQNIIDIIKDYQGNKNENGSN